MVQSLLGIIWLFTSRVWKKNSPQLALNNSSLTHPLLTHTVFIHPVVLRKSHVWEKQQTMMLQWEKTIHEKNECHNHGSTHSDWRTEVQFGSDRFLEQFSRCEQNRGFHLSSRSRSLSLDSSCSGLWRSHCALQRSLTNDFSDASVWQPVPTRCPPRPPADTNPCCWPSVHSHT